MIIGGMKVLNISRDNIAPVDGTFIAEMGTPEMLKKYNLAPHPKQLLLKIEKVFGCDESLVGRYVFLGAMSGAVMVEERDRRIFVLCKQSDIMAYVDMENILGETSSKE